MGNQHIIELNGQRYDALTGAMVEGPKETPKTKAKATVKTPGTGVSMDGFARPSRGVKQHAVRHPAEKSKTLMRKSVKKPAPAPAPVMENPAKPRIIATAGAKTRARHAGGVPRNPMVSRFGNPATAKQAASSATAKTATTAQRPAATAPKQHDAITRALARATSHEQPKIQKPRLKSRVASRLRVSPKLVSGGAFVLAFLLIGGFFAYQNIPGMTMRLAAARSGVQGHLPNYSPSGFRMNGGIAYKQGQITINYKSNSDNRNFKITQDTSNWDSQSLLDNYVVSAQRDYQTVQDKGKTIYMYNDSSATWVDGGIWYRIEGDSSLNSDQLLRLAASL